MKYFAITLVLAIVAFANASDLDSAEWMLRCAKFAISNGCAEGKIPFHTPLRVNKTLERSFNVGLISVSSKIHNITWAGIPEWELLSTSQISADSDATAKFNFHLYWPTFDINAEYEATATEFGIKKQLSGKVRLVMNEVNWVGVLSVVKPTFNAAASFPLLDLTWTADDIKADVTNAGDLGNTIATFVRLGLPVALHNGKLTIDHFITNILNTRWAQDGARVNRIITCCRNGGL